MHARQFAFFVFNTLSFLHIPLAHPASSHSSDDVRHKEALATNLTPATICIGEKWSKIDV